MAENTELSEIKRENGDNLYKTFSVQNLEAKEWEESLEERAEELDLWAIDIIELADRYRNYVIHQDKNDLETYGKMVWTLSFILKEQANYLNGNGHSDDEIPAVQEIETWGDWELAEGEEKTLSVPEKIALPVKRKPKRRIGLGELKAAFRKAVIMGKERYEKAVRESDLQIGFEMDVKNITDHLKETFNRVKALLSSGKEKASFKEILTEDSKEEKLTKFIHLLHLESEDRIRCTQKKFLGDIEIELTGE